jgi:hypothetical protein
MSAGLTLKLLGTMHGKGCRQTISTHPLNGLVGIVFHDMTGSASKPALCKAYGREPIVFG